MIAWYLNNYMIMIMKITKLMKSLVWMFVKHYGIESKVVPWLKNVPEEGMMDGGIYEHYGRYLKAKENVDWKYVSDDDIAAGESIADTWMCSECAIMQESLPCHCHEGRWYYEMVGKKQAYATSAKEVIRMKK